MSKRWSVGLLAFSAFVGVGFLGGCAEEDPVDEACEDDIVTAVDDDADFGDYETFAIYEIGGDAGTAGAGGQASFELPDDVVANIGVANAEAARQLVARGLTQVDPAEEDPDLWVLSAAAREEEEGTYWSCVPGWYWWGWYYYWDPCAWLYPIEFEYTVGTLLVATVDAATEKPVFGGVLQGILECSDELETRIESGVEEIFDDYPSN